jgi:hypothetical protein
MQIRTWLAQRSKRERWAFTFLFLSCVSYMWYEGYMGFVRSCIPAPSILAPHSTKFGVVTFWNNCSTEFMHMSSLSLPRIQQYVALHRKDMVLLASQRECLFPWSSNTWLKFDMLYALMLSRPDIHYFFWMDSDTYIVNLNRHLSSFVVNQKDMFITLDENGLNSGTFLLKNSEWSQQLMRTMMQLDNKPSYMHEQAGLVDYLSKHPLEDQHVEYFPQCAFNSYPGAYGYYSSFHRSDFVVHFAGQRGKYQAMEELLLRRKI